MYGWGDDTSISRSGGYSYTSARRAYTSPSTKKSTSASSSSSPSPGSSSRSSSSPRRTYSRTSCGIVYPLNKEIETDSPNPIVVAIDITGSMQEWPSIFFEKLPLLGKEAATYLPNNEISFAAIGDATCDSYPIQVCDFAKGPSLDKMVNSLYPEGGGGGGAKESYELTAFQYARHCKIPKAKNPMFFFLGDEGFYTSIEKGRVSKYIGDSIEQVIPSKDIFRELQSKFDVYAIRKSYGDSQETTINSQWKRILGEQHVIMLDDPRRVVDCILGVIASSAGKFDAFTKRLKSRQTLSQYEDVMTSLHHFSKKASGDDAVSLKKLPCGKTASKLI